MITDEMVEAALRGWDQFSALDAEENKDSSKIPDVKAFMRASLEAALGARPKMYADILLALRGVTPDNKLVYDAATCIEDLAEALKKTNARLYTLCDCKPENGCATAILREKNSAILEQWGLK